MALDNPVLKALRERRSIRKFTEDSITDEQLSAVLEAGRWAPSGKNNQPFRFLVLRRDDPRTEKMAELTVYSHIVRGADTLIGVFLDRRVLYHELKDHQSAGGCIQNMMLAAHSLGLGTVWIGQIMNNAPQVLDALELSPEDYEFIAFIAAGVPAQEGSTNRKPLEDLMIEPLS